MISIYFHNEDNNYTLRQKTKIKHWLQQAAKKEGYSIEEVNYIFCSDEYVLQVNQQFLNHNYYTDIITFDNADKEQKKQKLLVSDIFISIDRCKENAKTYNITTAEELHRILIHGLLHLCSYKDKTKATKQLMTQKEDYYLNLLVT